MGCFSTCFGNKRRCRQNRKRPLKTNPSLLHHLQTYESVEGFEVPQLIEEEKQEEIEKGENQSEDTPLILDDEKREKVHLSGKKKVTFDLNVQIYEDLRTEDEEDFEEYDDLLDKNDEEELEDEAEIKEEKYAKFSVGTQCNSDSSNSSLFSFPTNHRYRNCSNSDDEYDDMLSSDESGSDYYTDDDEDDFDGGNDEVESGIKHEKVEDQSSESLFSLSLDSRKHGFGAETSGDKEVNSPMPIKNPSLNESNSDQNAREYVESVLNPVENLSQWKFIKARSKLASKDQQAKENIISGQIGVDTSLSTWLVSSSKNENDNGNSRSSSASVGNNAASDSKKVSPNKFEDRPILGALTVEEIRLISATSSPRKSPSKSPEDVPIIGSVGSYWKHTDQTADSGSSTRSTKSRYRESAEVIWDATPFETRLEKALEKESNGEHILAI